MSTWPSPLRVHIGSGRCYLRGWVNVERDRPGVFLAHDRPDLAERWSTEDGDGYYSRVAVTRERVAAGPAPQDDIVCDVKADALQGWPFGCNTVDEVLARQVCEHFSVEEFRRFFANADYAVKPGGVLRLDLPDMDAAIERMLGTTDHTERALMRRHILGHRSGDLDRHYCGYSRERVKDLAAEIGFEFVEEENPLKDRWYPAYCLRFRKPALEEIDPIPWQRLFGPGEIQDHWRVLEIGPGSRKFWPRANVVMDIVDRGTDDRPPGSEFVQGDICKRTPFADHEFDFVYSSHVLEHVFDPAAAAAEISRIGRRGLIEVPWAFKEALFAFELDNEHRWWVHSFSGRLLFMPVDERRSGELRSKDVSAAIHRILRLGPQLGNDGQVLRNWYRRHHEAWNIVHRWEGELRVEVIL